MLTTARLLLLLHGMGSVCVGAASVRWGEEEAPCADNYTTFGPFWFTTTKVAVTVPGARVLPLTITCPSAKAPSSSPPYPVVFLFNGFQMTSAYYLVHTTRKHMRIQTDRQSIPPQHTHTHMHIHIHTRSTLSTTASHKKNLIVLLLHPPPFLPQLYAQHLASRGYVAVQYDAGLGIVVDAVEVNPKP